MLGNSHSMAAISNQIGIIIIEIAPEWRDVARANEVSERDMFLAVNGSLHTRDIP